MPCFDLQDALFLTNRWDAIRNKPASSDEDDDTHMQTKKHIHTKLRNGWPLMISTNIFHTSLQQVNTSFFGVNVPSTSWYNWAFADIKITYMFNVTWSPRSAISANAF